MTVTRFYQEQLRSHNYQGDEAQESAVARLQQFEDELRAFKRARSNRLMRFIHAPKVPRGVWMWGGVGRGKSFLMDCFYASVPIERKTRVHFHEFMRSVHAELDLLKGNAEPLDAVGASIAKRYRLICFDEFHVSDIADAMILERLLRALFRHGVTFVMTSNYEPAALYPDGLHRDRILPAIELLQEHLDVIGVDAGTDYRRRSLEKLDVYQVVPDKAESTRRMTLLFDQLLRGGANVSDHLPDSELEVATSLEVGHRHLAARRRVNGIVWFDFSELCGSARSQNDYLELADRFHTLLLSDVPEMGPAQHSEARRFTWLVDVLYDLRVKLMISAAVAPESLYSKGRMANEFARTLSRLIEMQSREYVDAPRRESSDWSSNVEVRGNAGH
jgi:cell division protein ZapE